MSIDDLYCRLADLKDALKDAGEREATKLQMQIAELEDDIACKEHDAEMDGDDER